MKSLFSFYCFLGIIFSAVAQQPKDVSITFTSDVFRNETYYLASYYGKYTVLLDSTTLAKPGTISFKREQPFIPGIYMLVDANKNLVTEFMMDDEQQFTIALNDSVPVITDSDVNSSFFEFNKLLKTTYDNNKRLTEQLASVTTKEDSLLIQQQLVESQLKLELYKKSYIDTHETDVLSLSFRLSRSVDSYLQDISAADTLLTKNDTLLFVKHQFLKGIDFNDERLLRTPFLENKLKTYFNVFVIQTPENITNEIQHILDSIKDRNSAMFSYLSLFFVNQYVSPTIMGLDAVFVSIYERYFKDTTYTWLKTEQQVSLKFSHLHIKDNLIGNKARNLFMTSIEGKQLNLFDVEAPYIVLVFWDPSCGHCKKELPKVKKMYDEQLKSKGVRVYAVNVNPDLEKEWKAFIEKEKLADWIHVHPTSVVYGNYTNEDVDFQTLYNVTQTPVLYLLDKDKIFRAKKIEIDKYPLIIKQLEKLAN